MQVEVERIGGVLRLCYEGLAAGNLVFPAPAGQECGIRDGLWCHTCCEAFVGPAGEAAYREFNFSPSGQWAVYGFSAYRQREDLRLAAIPAVSFNRDNDLWRLEANVPVVLLPDGDLELGLAVVLETAGGCLDYLALHHPAERPDFHDRRGFILRLPWMR